MQQADEKRISTRIPAELPVNILHDGEFQRTKSRDISLDGMYLYTDEPPAIRERATLCFGLEGEGEVEVEAEVVYVNHLAADQASGMAVKFTHVPTEARLSIRSFVDKFMLPPAKGSA